jgi:catechol 2,3-dioxygenase-like lactoylglutathione lyase family enzyme
MEGDSIDHVNIRIPDDRVDEALGFYRDSLGFDTMKLEEYHSGERTSFFIRISDEALINIRPKKNFVEPSGKNLDHFCITLEEDSETIRETLEEEGIEIIRESNPLGADGRASAFYVMDPFGYKLELKTSR